MPPQALITNLKQGLDCGSPDERTCIAIGIQDHIASICRERSAMEPHVAMQLVAAMGVLVNCNLCTPSKAITASESVYALVADNPSQCEHDCFTTLSCIDENLLGVQHAWEGLENAQTVFEISRTRMSEVVYKLVSELSLAQLASVVPELKDFSRVSILDPDVVARSIRAVTERESGHLPQVSSLEWQDILSTIRYFGVICQHESSCSSAIVPRLVPWLVDALEIAPLTELPKALRRMATAFAPWPIALESATTALQDKLPGMVSDVLARPWDQARGRPEWIVDMAKAVVQVQAVKETELQCVCKSLANALDAHSVWIAGILISKPSDQDERVRVLQQWLVEKLKRNPSEIDYMPARAFLVCQSRSGLYR